MASHRELYSAPLFRWAPLGRQAGMAVALAGLAVALWASTAVGVTLVLAGIALTLGTQLAVGVAGYRRAMRAEWPKVTPITDDWDD